MNASTITRRTAVIAGAAAAFALAASQPAMANYGWGGTLTPGSTACVGQQANYQMRGEGTATKAGAKFSVYRDGSLIYTTSNTASGFAAEFRSAWWNFPGPGFYTVCAANKNSTNTLVNIRVLVDSDF